MISLYDIKYYVKSARVISESDCLIGDIDCEREREEGGGGDGINTICKHMQQ